MHYFKGKNVLVYGMGKSGQAASKLLYQNDACVSIYDEERGFESYFCFDEDPFSKNYDLVVVSPGIKVIGNKLIKHFQDKGITIISELDLGFSFTNGNVVAITGTNGKTTVTSLIGEIFKSAGKECFVCGNIGVPISEIAQQTTKNSFVICEVSNFQLELSNVFNPDVACILNLQEDHIDRHGNFAEYVRVKNKITQNFSSKNLLIYNLDDSNVNLVKLPKRVVACSSSVQKSGAYIKNDAIYYNKTRVINLSDISLIGKKNIENVMFAVCVAMHFKIKPSVICDAIKNFKGVENRLEYVGRFDGVDYYNDSKSTNVACVQMAIESLKSENLILLLGGQNKDCSFAHMFEKEYKIKKVICFGQAGEEIYVVAKNKAYDAICFKNMKEAVRFSMNFASAGDTVLLSPGCASFDEFSSYVARGEVFKEIVSGKDFDQKN